MRGKAVGRDICHIWFDRDQQGKKSLQWQTCKLKKKGVGTYIVVYWNPAEGETYDNDAEYYDMTKLTFAADLIFEDLVLS